VITDVDVFSLSSLSDSEPPGITLRLQTGHERLFLSNHLSIHSIWYAKIKKIKKIKDYL
jgi:hypothetical protein